ncbi:hypothetical protein C8J57DRAFT_1528450 [Mycena rebaudengoi]|nr:hypothetical protein C8J57DRAFT_1528450 [Mycena rebaudengoi]
MTRTRTRPHPRVQTRGCTRDPCLSLVINVGARVNRVLKCGAVWQCDSPALIFFVLLCLIPPLPSSCSRSGSGTESISTLQTVASAPTAFLSVRALRHAQQRRDLLGENAPTSSCSATEPPRNRIPPALGEILEEPRHARPACCRILVVLCALQYLGQIVPEHPLHANSESFSTSPHPCPRHISSRIRHESARSPYLSISLVQVRNRVPNAAPGSVSSPMASPAPHTLPPTVLSPLSPASVFFLAHACPPPHPAAAAPLPPSPQLSRHRRASPASAALSLFAASIERRRLIVPKHRHTRIRRRSFEQW